MSIAKAENLKRDLTDKYVVVQEGIPELRRFLGLTGQVKTVNMNCRALVQFDGAADISWYDIDPSFLQIVDAPQPKVAAKQVVKPAVTTPSVPAETAAAGATKKLSPLELARQQGAGGAKKLSPLELARQQGGAKKPSEEATPASGKPTATTGESVVPPVPVSSSKPNIAEMLAKARQQGAVKKSSEGETSPQSEAAEPVLSAETPPPPPVVAPVAEKPAVSKPSVAEMLAKARQQGAAKKLAEPEAQAPVVEAPIPAVSNEPAVPTESPQVPASSEQPIPAKPSVADLIARAKQQGAAKK